MRLLKNTSLLVLAAFINRGFGLLLVAFIARRAGAEALGTYSLVMASYMLMLTMAHFNLDKLMIPQLRVAPETRSSLFGATLLLKLFLSAPFLILLFVLPDILAYPAEVTQGIRLLCIALPLDEILFVGDTGLLSVERANIVALRGSALAVLRVGFAIVALWMGLPFNVVFLAYIAASLLVIALQVSPVLRHVGFVWPKRDVVLSIINRSLLQFMGLTLFSTIFVRLDVLALGRLSTLSETGMYSASYLVFSFVMMAVSQSLVGVYSRLALLAYTDSRRLQLWGFRVAVTTGLLGIPAVITLALIANWMLPILLGKQFAHMQFTTLLLLLTALPAAVEGTLAHVLFASGRQHVSIISDIVGLIIAICLYGLMIPQYGAPGAALGFLVAYVCIAATTLLLGFRQQLRSVPSHHTWRWLLSLAIGIGAGGSSYMAGILSLDFSLMLGSGAYLLLVVSSGLLRPPKSWLCELFPSLARVAQPLQ